MIWSVAEIKKTCPHMFIVESKNSKLLLSGEYVSIFGFLKKKIEEYPEIYLQTQRYKKARASIIRRAFLCHGSGNILSKVHTKS